MQIENHRTSKNQEAGFWDDEWKKWYTRYSTGYPRLAAWLELQGINKEMTALEIGAGSARESRRLALSVKRITSIDFSQDVVSRILSEPMPVNFHCLQMDAFNLKFEDKSFDLTFHKGFWSLFDDEGIVRLLKEQARVTKRRMIIAVHNKANARMRSRFSTLARSDELYNVRFFDKAELRKLVNEVCGQMVPCHKLTLRKFGGANWMFSKRVPVRFVRARDRVASSLYACLPWARVESIVLDIELGTKA